ncbi:hypothetical protein L1987_41199 [Smallanthus sonchifolius]|uniref:Uncharacterized protein n=1 Tax=Smallanthus sonchifolius TaxID=185202 RepID=A0ACB9GVC7_9ASTR|nr:hypothetical protein L1987_41199 [Smallanthus sonchifolius]
MSLTGHGSGQWTGEDLSTGTQNTPRSGNSFRRGRGGRRLHLGDDEGLTNQTSIALILTAIANEGEVDSELLTPQKKLLNSIDVFEKVMMAELNRLKQTPSAKKAEWEKKQLLTIAIVLKHNSRGTADLDCFE